MARSNVDAYEVVRSRVMAGHYAPGAHLTEAAICDELEVGRSPVRAALRRLADEGLVRVEPHRGAFVAELTRADIDEVFELRQMLESRAAGLAATRRSEEQVTRLWTLVREMEKRADEGCEGYLDELHHNNRDFHLTILEAAGAPRSFQITKQLAETSVTLGAYFSYSANDIARSAQFHRDLAWAIESGNGQLASSLMATHIGVAHATFVATRFDNPA